MKDKIEVKKSSQNHHVSIHV